MVFVYWLIPTAEEAKGVTKQSECLNFWAIQYIQNYGKFLVVNFIQHNIVQREFTWYLHLIMIYFSSFHNICILIICNMCTCSFYWSIARRDRLRFADNIARQSKDISDTLCWRTYLWCLNFVVVVVYQVAVSTGTAALRLCTALVVPGTSKTQRLRLPQSLPPCQYETL